MLITQLLIGWPYVYDRFSEDGHMPNRRMAKAGRGYGGHVPKREKQAVEHG